MKASKDFQKMSSDFQLALKDFMERTDKISKNGLKRICKALTAYPLEEGIVNITHEDEVELYKRGTEIQSIKMTMAIESMRQDMEDERIKQARLERDRNGKT